MADLIRQYNKYSGMDKTLIQKALTAAAGSGEALTPQSLELVITNALPRLSPALAMVEPYFDNMKYHEFNRLVTMPYAGAAIGEGATTPTYSPAFQRTGVYMKIMRRKGATTDFLRDTSKKAYDAAATNIEACLLQFSWDMENTIMYGNASANQYEFSGLDTFIATNRTNKASGGAVPTTLKELDDLLDANMDYQGIGHKKAFVMSPYMLSKFSQLLTNVRLNQGLTGAFSTVDIPGGWRLNAYRDVPIIVSSACRPKTTMGTITPTTAASGGHINDSTTRYFRVAAVTKDGEQLASAEVSQATAGGGSNVNTITLSWTAVAGAYRYKIYCGSVSGTLYLTAVVPAIAYDSNGTPAASTTYTVLSNYLTCASGSGTTPTGAVTSCTFEQDPATAMSMVPTAMQSDVPLVASGGIAPEYVFLWDLDMYQGLGKLAYTNTGSRYSGLVTIEDLAKTDAQLPFMISSHCALADAFEATSSVIRGLRVA